MRTLIVGDVHGCSSELEKLISKVLPETVVLVGDLFTKGPDPVGVWRLIRDGEFRAVKGNHDERLLNYLDGSRKNDKIAAACVKLLDDEDLGWREWLQALPLFIELSNKCIVVHAGMHPSGSREKTTPKMALTMRRWDGEGGNGDYWYNQYVGDKIVIFGHDAARGRVRIERDGCPYVIGLDSGCVYGGELSGYVLEDDEIVTVSAAKVYSPL